MTNYTKDSGKCLMKKCKLLTTLESIDKWLNVINSGILKPKTNTCNKYSELPDDEINKDECKND
ncbi:hypothetical protein A9G09_12020 [Gilliamella sp. wkB292]|nr:hypothetical protein A9G09_12020 [Gilliamella apicola]